MVDWQELLLPVILDFRGFFAIQPSTLHDPQPLPKLLQFQEAASQFGGWSLLDLRSDFGGLQRTRCFSVVHQITLENFETSLGTNCRLHASRRSVSRCSIRCHGCRILGHPARLNSGGQASVQFPYRHTTGASFLIWSGPSAFQATC